MSDHSPLAPSSAARCVQCPGSVFAERKPEALVADDGIDAQEGTAAHWAGAEMIAGVLPQVGDRAPNGVAFTAAMLDAAEMWARDVHAVSRQTGTAFEHVETEKRVRIPDVHPDLGYGTFDTRLWAMGADSRPHLYLWDFKYGHRFVDARRNWQLIDYANGSLTERPGLDRTRVVVHMRVVQPRYYGAPAVREWVVTAAELEPFFKTRREAVANALGAAPRFNPGEECRDCRARVICPAIRKTAAGIADAAGREQPHGVPAEALGWELKYVRHALGILEAVESGLEQQAEVMLRRGDRVPGLAMRAGDGRMTWTVPAAQAIALAKMMGVDVARPVEAVTPLQAMGRGLPEAMVRGISKAGPGKASVVVDDGDLAARIGFGQ